MLPGPEAPALCPQEPVKGTISDCSPDLQKPLGQHLATSGSVPAGDRKQETRATALADKVAVARSI